MSQEDLFSGEDADIFADIEDNNDPDDPDIPVEFTSISGSGTSSSHLSQQHQGKEQENAEVRQVLNSAAGKPGPSSAPQVSAPKPKQTWTCPECSKVLHTKRGYLGHLSRFNHSENVAGPSQQPVLSLPVSKSQQVFTCPICHKTLGTKSGLAGHVAKHSATEICSRTPSNSQLKEKAMEKIMQELITEMLAEPCYEDHSASPKIIFLSEFERAKGNDDYMIFVNLLCDTICEIVCEKQSKLFPVNQYEECQKKLNSFLFQNDVVLKQKLVNVCEATIQDSLAGRLVFRIATKMFQKAKTWVLQQMQERRLEEASACGIVKQTLSKLEEQNFLVYLGDLLRKFFKRGLDSSSKRWQKRSECIKITFVNGPHPISSKEFLNKSNWFSGNEQSIVPSAHASSFFMSIETDIVPVHNSSAFEEVIEEILSRPEMLDHWYNMTHAYLTEEMALVFMRDFVSVYLKLSSRLEEKKLNRGVEKDLQATSVPLRTHLNRNFLSKADGEEDVE